MATGNTQQIIDYGTTPNDGTGDPLRTAFIKTDENFDNVWLAGPVGSNVRINNNTISTINTNGNIIIKPDGVGIIQANASIVPNTTNTRDLGSANLVWRRLYVGTLSTTDLSVDGDLTVTGNLTVDGDIVQIGNLVTDALTIQLANTATTANAANGAGITVGAYDNTATMLYSSSSNVWNTNIGITAVGNITAPYFIGNGSQLTGIVSSYGNANVAEYLPTYNGNINAGNINVNEGAFVGNNATIVNNLNVKTGTFTGDAVGRNAIYAGFPTFTVLGSDVIAQFSGNTDAYMQFNFQNGSNGPQSSGDYVITADNGTDTTHFLNIGLASSTWDGTQNNSLGNLLAPNDGYFYVQDGNLVIGTQENGNTHIHTWTWDTTGNVTATGNLIPSADLSYSLGNTTNLWNTVFANSVTTNSITNPFPIDITSNVSTWQFAENILRGPQGDTWQSAADTSYFTSPANGYITLESVQNGNVVSELFMEHSFIRFLVDNGGPEKTWQMNLNGSFSVPGDIIPQSNGTASLGNATNYWSNLWVANNTIYIGGVPLGMSAGNILTVNGAEVVTTSDNDANIGNLAIYSATIAIKPGAPDTDVYISPSGESHAFLQVPTNDTANVTNTRLHNDAGNVEIGAGDTTNGNPTYEWKFTNTGNLTLPNNGSIIVDGDGVIGPDGDDMVISWDNEELILRSVQGSVELQADNDVSITTSYGAGDFQWIFGNNNELVNITGDSAIVTEAGNLAISGGRDGLSSGNVTVRAVDVGVAVRDWTFDNAGDLTVPNYIYFKDGTFIGDEGGALPPVFRVDSPLGLGIDLTTDSNISGNNYTWSFGIDGILTAPGDISTTGNISGNTAGYAIGYRDIPQVSFTGDATIATTDSGKHYYSTQSTDYILTIANNASQGFQVGAAISIVNQGTGNITIAQGSGVTLYLAGNATSGNRTLSTFGMATIMKVATDTWFINGTGVV